MTSVGFCQCSTARGRSFSSRWTRLISRVETVSNSVPFGKYCRSRPLVFSFVPRSHGDTGMREVDDHTGINCELFVFAHLLALIIGQGLRDFPRQRSECFRIGVPHRCRVFRVERDQKGIPRHAFHQGAERGALMRAQDEVALPVAGERPDEAASGRGSCCPVR